MELLRHRGFQLCTGTAVTLIAAPHDLKRTKNPPIIQGVVTGVRVMETRLFYDNHQRAEMVACMLLSMPLTLKQMADEVEHKGCDLHGFHRRPSPWKDPHTPGRTSHIPFRYVDLSEGGKILTEVEFRKPTTYLYM